MARSIPIERGPVRLTTSTTRRGATVIRHPRGAPLAAGAVLLAVAALLLPVLFRRETFWEEPMHIAVVLLLMTPGLWNLQRAFRRRVVLTVADGELAVACGPAFLERRLLSFPLDGLEWRVGDELVMAVRYDAHAVNQRLLAGINPLARGRLESREVSVHVLQVRGVGQSEWLSLFGSQLASEVESAGLVLGQAVRAAKTPTDAKADDDSAVSP